MLTANEILLLVNMPVLVDLAQYVPSLGWVVVMIQGLVASLIHMFW